RISASRRRSPSTTARSRRAVKSRICGHCRWSPPAAGRPAPSTLQQYPRQSLPPAQETTENEYHTDEEEDLVGEEEGGTGIEGEEGGGAGEKRKRPLNKSLGGFSKRGVCYLSRVPPHMNPSHVRQIFSKYGEVQRIYLVPEGQGHRKHSNVKAKAYSEGYVVKIHR
uniref:RRM domain-containing protein n=1 Tax=Triticum urartu TaxID=4572 RepID=A0A8R7P5C6_TRIUA